MRPQSYFLLRWKIQHTENGIKAEHHSVWEWILAKASSTVDLSSNNPKASVLLAVIWAICSNGNNDENNDKIPLELFSNTEAQEKVFLCYIYRDFLLFFIEKIISLSFGDIC